MAILNFVLMVGVAFYFSGNILQNYDHDAISVAVVCMWIVSPYLLTNFLMLHRINVSMKEFPVFEPYDAFIHKASRFTLDAIETNLMVLFSR